jgi:uncharacterized membrane protein (TIGR02234 family)
VRRSSRATVVLAAAAASVLLLVTASRPWLYVTLTDALSPQRSLAVTGARAAPVVPALALVALASAGALTVARRIGRVAALVAVGAAGVGAAVAIVWALADPAGAARAAVAEATGVTAASVALPAADTEVSAWPWLALGSAVAVLLVAGWGWTARAAWPTTRRFDAGSPADARREDHPGDAWDALSRGDDPTRDADETTRDGGGPVPRRAQPGLTE